MKYKSYSKYPDIDIYSNTKDFWDEIIDFVSFAHVVPKNKIIVVLSM